jgi:hypothetical protein
MTSLGSVISRQEARKLLLRPAGRQGQRLWQPGRVKSSAGRR